MAGTARSVGDCRAMGIQQRARLDTILQHLTLVGFGVLAAWCMIVLYGTIGGLLEVNHQATFRFLFVIMVLVYAHHFMQRLRERRLRQLPDDVRYGFTTTEDAATGSPQAEG